MASLPTILDTIGTESLVALIGLLSVLCITCGATYRIFLSPISHIPGPKLAALTYFYQFYFDVYPHQGRWIFQQQKLHEQYGPIVRVGPNELHIKDADFYNTAFGSHTKRRNKSKGYHWEAGTDESIGGSVFQAMDHDMHHMRRSALNPFFSKRKVQELEDRILVHVEKAKARLLSCAGSEEVTDLLPLMSAFSMDVISEYSFGKSSALLDTPDLGKPMRNMIEEGVKLNPFARQFPIVGFATLKAAKYLSGLPMMRALDSFNKMMDSLTVPAHTRAIDASRDGKSEAENSIIGALALSDTLPSEEKRFGRIRSEAFVLIGAGTETTGRTLAVGVYHILANPAIHSRLLSELRTIMPNPKSDLPSVTALGRLPYLTAVIHEATRLAHGVTGRLVRIAPDEDLQYAGYTIPRGVPFSVSNYIHHTDPSVFPDPFTFKPERYLGPNAAENLRNLVPFGKGPRMCLGINLAWAEMYSMIAAVISGVKMELYQTTDRDLTIEREYFVGLFPKDSKGIRIKVLGLQE